LWRDGYFLNLCNKWVGQAAVNGKTLSTVLIPLPPLEIQRQIVDEIEVCQRVINGARQVVEAWKPNLEVELEEERKSAGVDTWDVVKLGDVCDVKTGKLNSNAATENGQYPFFTCSKDVFRIDTFAFDCEAILLSGNNASGDFDVKHYKGKFNAYQRTYVITIKEEFLDSLDYQIVKNTLENNLASLKGKSIGGLTKYLTLGMITSIEVPKPPLEIQRAIVERIESERRAVEGCQGLIAVYEGKIQKIVGRMWEG